MNIRRGRFAGMAVCRLESLRGAPGAKLVGLSAGDATLLYVLGGLDYLLSNPSLGVRVVNCSFSANTRYDTNDPVNVATKMLTDSGINVVFSAGNTGPGTHTLNPSRAPGHRVGATDAMAFGGLFFARDFASPLFNPLSLRRRQRRHSARLGITNLTGRRVGRCDTQKLNAGELPNYTNASGTSFSAPQVAGAIALMLEANPSLTPANVKDILKRTATPMASYFEHEVGAGMLNVHAAVLQSAFPGRRMGDWRKLHSTQVQFSNDPLTPFNGTVHPGANSDTTLKMPSNAVFAAIQIGWGPLWTTNDLGVQVYNNAGSLVAQANSLNLLGLTGKQEKVSLIRPAAGNWRVSVRNTLGAFGTSQPFNGVLQVGRASYADE